jgi:type I restriction enzyme S subunit
MSKTSKNISKLRFPEFKGEPEWKKKSINQISKTITAGGTPSTLKKEYWGGNIRWMNSGELNNKKVFEVQGRITEEGLKNSSTKLIPENCILIGLAGQGKTRGTVAINRVELCTNQSIAAIYPNKEIFNSDFIYHNLDNRYKELRNLSAGSEGRGGLNLTLIKSINVHLPSKEEQKKVADCITSIDNLILSSSKKVEALKEHKKGLMQQLFPQEGENVPKLLFPEFGDEWGEKFLNEVLDYERPDKYTVSNTNYKDEGIPVLTANKSFILGYTDDKDGIYKDIPRVIFDDFTTDKKYVDFPFKVKSSAIKILKAKGKNNLKTIFEIMNQIEFDSSQHKRYYIAEYQNLMIKLPKPLEQEKIANFIFSIDSLIETQTQKVEALKEHKKGLMQQLFPNNEETR